MFHVQPMRRAANAVHQNNKHAKGQYARAAKRAAEAFDLVATSRNDASAWLIARINAAQAAENARAAAGGAGQIATWDEVAACFQAAQSGGSAFLWQAAASAARWASEQAGK